MPQVFLKLKISKLCGQSYIKHSVLEIEFSSCKFQTTSWSGAIKYIITLYVIVFLNKKSHFLVTAVMS
jgi:hypothetical protein